MAKAEVGKRYQHYKGCKYEVIALAHDEETLVELVVYRALYDTEDFGSEPVWVRARTAFEEKVEIDGVLTDRFVKL